MDETPPCSGSIRGAGAGLSRINWSLDVLFIRHLTSIIGSMPVLLWSRPVH